MRILALITLTLMAASASATDIHLIPLEEAVNNCAHNDLIDYQLDNAVKSTVNELDYVINECQEGYICSIHGITKDLLGVDSLDQLSTKREYKVLGQKNVFKEEIGLVDSSVYIRYRLQRRIEGSNETENTGVSKVVRVTGQFANWSADNPYGFVKLTENTEGNRPLSTASIIRPSYVFSFESCKHYKLQYDSIAFMLDSTIDHYIAKDQDGVFGQGPYQPLQNKKLTEFYDQLKIN